MNRWRIRAATPGDVDDVAALETALFGLDAWTAPGVRDELDPRSRVALVALDEAGLVGYAVAAVAMDTAELHRVAVDPGSRRLGVATELLARLRDEAREAGATRMLLEVSVLNEAALDLYRAAGWRELDRRPRYYRDGSDALVLSLALTREPA